MTSIDAATCAARAAKMLSPTPPMRYEPTSPYPANTQYELDMRRKAEILKYQNTTTNTKTNNLTKRQKFARIINSTGGSVAAALTEKCAATDVDGANTPLPAYYSGIRGGARQMLYYNPKIPLYNYQSIIKTTASEVYNATSPASSTDIY